MKPEAEPRIKHGICYECRTRCEGRFLRPWRQVIVRGRSYEFCGDDCQEVYLGNLRRVTELPEREIETLRVYAEARTSVVRSSRGPHALVRAGVLMQVGRQDSYRWTQHGIDLAVATTGHRPRPRVFRYRMENAS